ncbi:Serine protease AprX [Anaerohalosphaera lusitana]|uniref:Serine protease AprX n=1 Tax=Anaerohalosphaera lusitana TaxID=1936003 RepID=A0A1U9NR75_9BACT|nr:S8 family serine peptidase [Anaerohalosphaera lusitana]AQT70244.1 Serine protease AprX [Anaerohalosphaera lusitana]
MSKNLGFFKGAVMKRGLLVAIAFVFSFAGLAAAAELNVPSQYTSIQTAIDAAVDGDVVTVADGTYAGPGFFEIDFNGKAITVKSANGPDNCIIDGGSAARAFYFHNGELETSRLEGFTIRNCYDASFGGAIECEASSPTIANCVFDSNVSYDGGAIDFYQSGSFVVDCVFINNGAERAGGALELYESNVTITNCLFDGNFAATSGGAIDCYASSPSISNVTIVNSAGGGIVADASSAPQIKNSIFSDNDVDMAGCSADYSRVSDKSAYDGMGNIDGDPLFTPGPKGAYYLSQTSAGQVQDSPCIDEGYGVISDLTSVGIGYTTNTSSLPDENAIDMGYHYPDTGAPGMVTLTTTVVGGNGTLSPDYPTGQQLPAFSRVELVASPDQDYRVAQWTNTDDDSSQNNTNYVTLPASGSVEVTVEFELALHTLTLVPSDNGEITADPAGTEYLDGQIVTLTATPVPPYNITGWFVDGVQILDENDANYVDTTLDITMDSSKEVEVTYSRTCRLSARVDGGVGGAVDPTRASYPEGDVAVITALPIKNSYPDERYVVDQWMVTVDGNAAVPVVVDVLAPDIIEVEVAPDVFATVDPAEPHVLNLPIVANTTVELYYRQLEAPADTFTWQTKITTHVDYDDGELHGEMDPAAEIPYTAWNDPQVPDANDVTVLPDMGWSVATWGEDLDGDGVADEVYDPTQLTQTVEFYQDNMTIVADLWPAVQVGGDDARRFTTIQEAIDDAVGGNPALVDDTGAEVVPAVPAEEVVIADGVYKGEGNVDLEFNNKLINLKSASEDPTKCIIDCEGAATGFIFDEIDGANVEGISVINGSGGAVQINGIAAPAFTNCIFRACTGNNGGAVSLYYPEDPQPVVDGYQATFDEIVAGLPDGTDPLTDPAATAAYIDWSIATNLADPDLEFFPAVINTIMAENQAGGRGGAVYAELGPIGVYDCLITQNTSGDVGGACYFSTSDSEVQFCTVVANRGADQGGDRGIKGGIGAENSAPVISHCIIGYSDGSMDRPWGFGRGDDVFGCQVDWSVVENIGGDEAVDMAHISTADPQFAVGPMWTAEQLALTDGLGTEIDLNTFYLSQPPTHPVTSPAYNAGNPEENLWNQLVGTAGSGLTGNETTRITGGGDGQRADYGYHYPVNTNDDIMRTITLRVLNEGGSMTYEYFDAVTGETSPDEPDNVVTYDNPVTLTVSPGTVIDLEALPEDKYRVYQWYGTDDDTTFETMNTATVYEDGQEVALEFEITHREIIYVPTQYPDIQRGIDAARDGDVVIVSPGTYRLPITIIGKDIVLSGEFPDDPDRWPIIDVGGEAYNGITVIGSYFLEDRSGSSLVNGFKVRNAQFDQGSAPPAVGEGALGNDGRDSYGGGVIVYGDHTIRNCQISDCYKRGQDATGGNNGGNNVPDGGDSGWGGDSGGGGIHIAVGEPLFEKVTVEGCFVEAGSGANGGNGGTYGRGGDGGCPGEALGGAVYIGGGTRFANDDLTAPTFVDCVFRNNFARGSNGGNGGSRGGQGGRNGYGGIVTVVADIEGTYVDPARPQGDPRLYTAKGGAIYAQPETEPNFVGCEFVNNWTESGMSGVGQGLMQPMESYYVPTAGGGVFVALEAKADFTDCVFEGNENAFYGEDFTGYGGALCTGLDYDYEIGPLAGEEITPSIDVTLDTCVFDGNASTIGGATYGANIVHLDIADCNYVNNSAYLAGGAMIFKTLDANMADTIFQGNNAYESAVADSDHAFAIGDQEVLNRGVGGGFIAANSDFWGENLEITENSASGSGGGVYLAGHPKSLVTPQISVPVRSWLKNCLIADNEAGASGAGVFVNFEHDGNLRNCTIANNSVMGGESLGGGLYIAYGSRVDVKDSIIWRNKASSGAQITLDSQSFVIADETVDYFSSLDIDYADVGPFPDPNDIQLHDAFAGTNDMSNVLTPSTESIATVVDKDEIFNRFQTQDRVKVMVTLRDAAELIGSTNFTSDVAREALRAEVTQRIDNVIVNMGAHELQLRNRCENIPVFSGEVTQTGYDKLRTNSNVAFIEPVRQVRPALRQAIPQGNAEVVRQFYNGEGASVAIVDSGVDYTHTMLGGDPAADVQFPNEKVIGGYDTGNGDADPFPAGEPHGTACAGIAGGWLGEVEDYIGGVAYNAGIYALKMTDDAGMWWTDAGVQAWDWCVTHQYDDPDRPIVVISNSWGGFIPYEDEERADRENPALAAAAQVATSAGISVFAASGNFKEYLPVGISTPSALSKVVSVGALYDTTGEVTEYSQTGELLDILAPADPVYTTDIVGEGGYDPGDYFPFFNGTSSACPFAAGCVASIQSAALDKLGDFLTPGQIKELLVTTGVPTPDGTYPEIVKPAVDLGAAIINLVGAPPIEVDDGSYINGEQIFGWDPNTDFFDDPAVDVGNSFVADPLFVGDYYLSQVEAGQLETSPAVDRGSGYVFDPGIELADFHTRTDGVNDEGIVDMGYHHFDTQLTEYELTTELNYPETMLDGDYVITPEQGTYIQYKTVKLQIEPELPEGFAVRWTGTNDDDVAGPVNYVTMDEDKHVTAEIYSLWPILVVEVLTDNGTVSIKEPDGTLTPAGVTVHQDGDVVNLVAHPDNPSHRIKWYGTDDDSASSVQNSVTIDGNTTVQVKFYEPRTIEVAGDFTELQYAIYDAQDGDIITLQPAEYTPIQGLHLVIDKAITIQSMNPDDPETVANTIIRNCGFIVAETDRSTVFNGLTILDAHYISPSGCPGLTPCNPLPDGKNGEPITGGAFEFVEDASATVKNCRIESCSVTAGHGGDGGQGGDGGWGGWAHGGAAYVGPGGSPKFVNCEFIDNEATGGNGGNAGNGGVRGGSWDEIHNPWPDWDYGPYIEYWKYSGYGGAVYCDEQSTPEFVDCYFSGNTAHGPTTGQGVIPAGHYQIETYGGAIYAATGSSPKFTNCVFDNNEADREGQQVEHHDEPTTTEDPFFAFGGAIAFEHECKIELIDCDFDGNTAHNGGAIYAEWADPQVTDCNFVNNSSYNGGALYYNNGRFTVDNTRFHGNVAAIESGLGGAIYGADANSVLTNISLLDNSASGSGGGIFLYGSGKTTVENALIANNTAGRDGGGFSANWYAKAWLNNCTIADNQATRENSLGGGLSVSYGSEVDVLYSIIWDNSASIGASASVMSDYQYDKVPSTLTIDYTDVWNGLANLNVGEDCTLNWGDNNFGADLATSDPLFAPGPMGDYYLQQPPLQEKTSPAVDYGDISALEVGLHTRTTNTLPTSTDQGRLDLGYHYVPSEQGMPEQCRICDLDRTWDSVGSVDTMDFMYLADNWLFDNCGPANDWCNGADFTVNGKVDLEDLAEFASCWLALDTRAPLPDPAEWAPSLEPHIREIDGVDMIYMGAQESFDSWSGYDGGMMYEFECLNYAPFSRLLPENRADWTPAIRAEFQDPNYVSDYVQDFDFQFRTRAVDPRGNTTGWSGIRVAGAEVRPEVRWIRTPQSVYAGVTPVELYAEAVELDANGDPILDENDEPILDADADYYFAFYRRPAAGGLWELAGDRPEIIDPESNPDDITYLGMLDSQSWIWDESVDYGFTQTFTYSGSACVDFGDHLVLGEDWDYKVVVTKVVGDLRTTGALTTTVTIGTSDDAGDFTAPLPNPPVWTTEPVYYSDNDGSWHYMAVEPVADEESPAAPIIYHFQDNIEFDTMRRTDDDTLARPPYVLRIGGTPSSTRRYRVRTGTVINWPDGTLKRINWGDWTTYNLISPL